VFIVFGELAGETRPTASFCQIILDDPMSVQGYLVPYDGEADPCPSTGEPERFEPGLVVLNMVVIPGPSSDPVLCDERVVEIAGDQHIDFSDVIACG